MLAAERRVCDQAATTGMIQVSWACVAALGAAALGAGSFPAAAQAPGAPPEATRHPEVVITGTRLSDAILVAKVEQALHDDRYIFTDHITVTAANGVVKLEGETEDISDMLQAVRLARRIAGGRRVINRIEIVTSSELLD
jgi:BON domain